MFYAHMSMVHLPVVEGTSGWLLTLNFMQVAQLKTVMTELSALFPSFLAETLNGSSCHLYTLLSVCNCGLGALF